MNRSRNRNNHRRRELSRLKETFSRLKEFFGQKNTVVDREEGSDDYTVKRSKKADIIIRIFSILAAIIIWIYAVSTDGNIKTTDYQFTSNDITIKNESVLNERNFDISLADTNIVVTVKGRKLSATDAKRSRVKLSVDAATVTAAGDTMLKLDIDLPIGVALVSVSPEFIRADITTSPVEHVDDEKNTHTDTIGAENDETGVKE
jgi:YbbR domain-containing protein